MRQNYHLLIVDLFPLAGTIRRESTGRSQPQIDGVEATDFQLPPDRPLTLVAYEAKPRRPPILNRSRSEPLCPTCRCSSNPAGT